MYMSIPFMTQSFTSMHKLPRGRNFYPRGFDFAFGECDYFPPLRYLYSCRCLRTVNLAVVSIRALFEVSRRGRHEPPSMALACLSAHRVRFPAIHLLPGCLTSARFTKRRTNGGADIRRALEISARKNANKETSI